MDQTIVQLNVDIKLRRFCFLGSLDPVYVCSKDLVNVKTYLPLIENLCKTVDTITLATLLSDALHSSILVRRDESIFIYAVYLGTDVKEQFKKEMRLVFNNIIRDDSDLFLFCKYASLIRKERGLKGFSRTVRKAIRGWYEEKTPDEIRAMWLMHRGQHNFTHKSLIKLCFINDRILGGVEVAEPFFHTCTELLKRNAATNATTNTNSDENSAESKVEIQTNSNTNDKDLNNEIPHNNVVLAMAKLRVTKSKHQALKIIQKLKLNFNQVPCHFLKYANIVYALLPAMTYLQLLQCWKYMVRYGHLNCNKIYHLYEERLKDKALRRASHIKPITLLINMRKEAIRDVTNKNLLRTHFMNRVYEESFHGNYEAAIPMDTAQPDVRIHITMNLQNSYRIKYLKNHSKMSYYEAAVSLAFGYFKSQPNVDVYYWIEERLQLRKIFWNKYMNINMAYAECSNIHNDYNGQRLIAPIKQALSETESANKKYCVFLCIVPTSGRGNPQHSSKLICSFLDKYRKTRYPKAKFIILQLLKFRPSLKYSQSRVENILEICGLDEHTTTIIDNFIYEKFC